MCAHTHTVFPSHPLFSVVLHGLDLESEHCMFANQTGTVTLVPLNGAQCSVNGVQVTEASPLNQGMRFWSHIIWIVWIFHL